MINFLRAVKTDREKLAAREFVKKYIVLPMEGYTFLEYPVSDKAFEKYNNKKIIGFLIKADLLKKGRKILTKKSNYMRVTIYYHEWKWKYDCDCGIKYSSRLHYCPKCGAKAIVY